jgi:hypothetical protein
MAVVNLKGSEIMTGLDASPASLADASEAGGRTRYWREKVEVTTGDSNSSTYLLARLPSNARIHGASKIYWDDLASAGSPTLDVGCYPLTGRSNISADPDALNDGLDIASAGTTGSVLIKTIDNFGLPLWDFCSGIAADPKGEIDIKAKIVDADVTAGGTIVVELYYSVD